MLVYKLCSDPDWRKALSAGVFHGAAIDFADGYIHLSTAEQVLGTFEKYFAEVDPVWLIGVETAKMSEKLRFEPSRDGALFPHLYAPLQLADVQSQHCLANNNANITSLREILALVSALPNALADTGK
jgi:uncharacterized protein (DUF952 family)